MTTPTKVSTAIPAPCRSPSAKQSGDIAMGVDKALEAKTGEMTDAQIESIGAGDQGMMFGYRLQRNPHPDAHADLHGAPAGPPDG